MRSFLILLLVLYFVSTALAGVYTLHVAPLESNLFDFDVQIMELKGLRKDNFSFNLLTAGKTSKVIFIPSPSFEEAYLHAILSDGSAETFHFVIDPSASVYHKVFLRKKTVRNTSDALKETEKTADNFQIKLAQRLLSIIDRLEEAHQLSLAYEKNHFGLQETLTKYWKYRDSVVYEITIYNETDDDILIQASDYLDDTTLAVYIPGMDEFARYLLSSHERNYVYILKEKL